MSTELLQEVREDVKEIKSHVIELIKQGAIANQVLIEHERRSTNLESRMEPLEKDYSFRSKLFAIVTSGGVVAGITALVKYLSR